MTSKDIALLMDSGSFLQYIQVCVFIGTILAFTPFFTFKINKLQQIIGGAEAPQPPPPLPTGLPTGPGPRSPLKILKLGGPEQKFEKPMNFANLEKDSFMHVTHKFLGIF